MSRLLGPLVSLPQAHLPSPTTLQGRTVLLQHLQPTHADDLYTFIGGNDPTHAALWDYMGDEPYEDLNTFRKAIISKSTSTDPFHFAILDKTTNSKPVGYLSLMRITPDHFTVELGNILFSPSLQRSTCATEAIYLALRYAFDLGYRRLEWKCNALNEPSRRAALRLGFTFEGIFRQHMVIKGRNRDTAWYAMLKDEWDGGVRGALERWLDECNFDSDGRQKKRLEEFR